MNKQYQEQRLAKLKQDGGLTYPHKFQGTSSLENFLDSFMFLERGQSLETEGVSVSGRIHSIREVGKNLLFIDLHQNEFRLQIKADKRAYRGDFHPDLSKLQRGDVIGVIDGYPSKTKAGELSIVPKKIKLLAPCLKILPTRGLEEPNFKYRHRHVDLMINPQVRAMFYTRSKIIKYIRKYLDDKDFVEVETPILGAGAGGATAEPFKTHHNELNVPMWLRIAPELPLKQLVIGGLDRVYEIGKQFRNEGVNRTHNPEFTSCEFYMAYADYNDLMDMTEEMLSSVFKGLTGSSSSGLTGAKGGKYIVKKNMLLCVPDFEPNNANDEQQSCEAVNFSNTPYPRIDYIASLESATGKPFPEPQDLIREDAIQFMTDLCQKHGLHYKEAHQSPAKLLDKLFSKLVEHELQVPTFVMDHPLCMSPLAKEHRSRPGVAERFELYARGVELVNSYTELNDPFKQREAFDRHDHGSADDVNEAFVNALEYGLPPTAGWGLGIDRLVMLLTGQNNIRDVILFPAVKPIKSQ